MRALRREEGQATVELVALIPLMFLVALAVAQVLAAGLAREAAHHAAEAGAVAMLEGGDPARDARAAAPGWSRDRLTVTVVGRSVRVRVQPPALVPGVAGLLQADSTAAAGPAS
jgi:Flp pilus assembly protein TadG